MAKASAAGTWRGACRPEHYNLDYNRFNGVLDDEGEDLAPTGDSFSDMLRNPNVPPQLKEAFRLSQVAKQTNDMAAQARADELVRAAILKGGPEIQKRFEQTLGEMQEDGRVKEKLSGTGAALPSAKAFLEGKGLVPESFFNDAEAPVDLKSKMQHKLDSTHGVLDKLAKTQASLENIKSPDQMADFFHTLGWTEEDVVRASKDEEFAKHKMLGELHKLLPETPGTSDLDKLIGDMDSFLEDTKDGLPASGKQKVRATPSGARKSDEPAAAPVQTSGLKAEEEEAMQRLKRAQEDLERKRREIAEVTAPPAVRTAYPSEPAVAISRAGAEVVATISLPGVISMAA